MCSCSQSCINQQNLNEQKIFNKVFNINVKSTINLTRFQSKKCMTYLCLKDSLFQMNSVNTCLKYSKIFPVKAFVQILQMANDWRIKV